MWLTPELIGCNPRLGFRSFFYFLHRFPLSVGDFSFVLQNMLCKSTSFGHASRKDILSQTESGWSFCGTMGREPDTEIWRSTHLCYNPVSLIRRLSAWWNHPSSVILLLSVPAGNAKSCLKCVVRLCPLGLNATVGGKVWMTPRNMGFGTPV